MNTLQNSVISAAFRPAKRLVGGYLAISTLSLAAVVVLRDHPAQVNSAVWSHGIFVFANALVTAALTIRAARGSRGALRRLRIMSAAMVVAIAVIIALPGSFPLWMKVEQGASGLLLIGVAMIVNRADLRAAFATVNSEPAAPERIPAMR
jgi:hypothetical protein